MTLELDATVCLRTPNALLATVNQYLAKPIANTRHAQ
jgi:hypothetical protein